MDARQIIDYAADDNAKDFREALYASIYDKVNAHMENMKQQVAQNLVTQEEKECDNEKEGHDDEKEDKALVKKMVKKDALKTEEVEINEATYEKHDSFKHKDGGEIGLHKQKYTGEEDKWEINHTSFQLNKKHPRSGGDWHSKTLHSGTGDEMKKKFAELKSQHMKEEVEEIEEAVTRKHFQMVADLIKSHEDPAKRKELAQHHAEIFKQQNPRFDHAKFMKAAGASE